MVVSYMTTAAEPDTSNNLSGVVRSAELCLPLVDVKVIGIRNGRICEEARTDHTGRWRLSTADELDTVIFRKAGFVTKSLDADSLPSVVRLLEDQLIGYQSKLWFLPGEEVLLYTHSPTCFSAKLCRHGFNKSTVLDLGFADAHEQLVPNGYFVESGLAWNETLRYAIPHAAQPGLYSMLLQANSQHDFAIPMIVSTSPQLYGKYSKLLVLASTNTWQMYNLWGGRSRYRNYEGAVPSEFLMPRPRSILSVAKNWLVRTLPPDVIKVLMKVRGREQGPELWRHQRLSLQRPITNCRLEEGDVLRPFTNHLAGGEWRLLAWLERENIAYDIVSGAELHRKPDLLRHYRAVVLSTHCEYWTRDMYEGLRHFHEKNGLWVLNLSGNTMYREIELDDDGSARWIGVFSETLADETQLLGVRLSPLSYGTCAPYEIVRPQHWVFDGCPIHERSKVFGGMSLNQNTVKDYSRYDPGRPGLENGLEGIGASGWETDELGKKAPRDFIVVAKGLHRRGTSHMVVREAAGSRGGVLSASSIVFGGCLLIDSVASTIVRNVISKAVEL